MPNTSTLHSTIVESIITLNSIESNNIINLSIQPTQSTHQSMSDCSTSSSYNTDERPVVESLIPISEFDCSLCFELLFDIVTLPQCSHSFCRHCITYAISIKQQCPICRAMLHTVNIDSISTNVLLESLISKYYPIQYNKRTLDIIKIKRTNKIKYNLFITSSPYFPGQSIQLHIYEAKYRLLVNSALTGSQCFVMAYIPYNDLYTPQQPQQQQQQHTTILGNIANTLYPAEQAVSIATQSLLPSINNTTNTPDDINNIHNSRMTNNQPNQSHNIGTLCRITRARIMPDGRSLVEAIGLNRVKISNIHEVPNSYGLMCAECDNVSDNDRDVVNALQRANELNDSTSDAYQGVDDDDDDDDTDDTVEVNTNNNTTDTPDNTNHTNTVDNDTTEGADGTNEHEPAVTDGSRSTQQTNTQPIALPGDTVDSEQINTITAQIYRELDDYIRLNHTTIERLTHAHGTLPQQSNEIAYWYVTAAYNIVTYGSILQSLTDRE